MLTPQKVPVTVVGISKFGDEDAFGETSFTAFPWYAREYVAKGTDRISGVAVRAGDGVSQAELASRIEPVLPGGVEAITTKAQVEEGMSLVESGFLRIFRTVLAAFGGVALLVAAFSIHNTFAITMAQRTRESALLRALGSHAGRSSRSSASRPWSSAAPPPSPGSPAGSASRPCSGSCSRSSGSGSRWRA